MKRSATLKQLNALYVTAKLGSVSRAAEELHLSQPTVSLQLRLLEEAAGMVLLKKHKRGVQLTPAGEIMNRSASRILSAWQDASDELDNLKGDAGGKLRVAALTTAEYLLPPILVAFCHQFPHTQIELRTGTRDEVVRMLETQEVEIAILSASAVNGTFAATRFAAHPMAFIAPTSHHLAKRKSVALTDVVASPLLIRERGTGTRLAFEQLLKKENIPLPKFSELSSNVAIKRMVAAGHGVGFLSLHACKFELDFGFVTLLPLNIPLPESHWSVLRLASTPLSKLADQFQTFLLETAEDEIYRQLGPYLNAANAHAGSQG